MELQKEREKNSVLTHRCQELTLEQQQHKQQLEAMEASRAMTAEGFKQLTTSLETQVSLVKEQQERLIKLQEEVPFSSLFPKEKK